MTGGRSVSIWRVTLTSPRVRGHCTSVGLNKSTEHPLVVQPATRNSFTNQLRHQNRLDTFVLRPLYATEKQHSQTTGGLGHASTTHQNKMHTANWHKCELQALLVKPQSAITHSSTRAMSTTSSRCGTTQWLVTGDTSTRARSVLTRHRIVSCTTSPSKT